MMLPLRGGVGFDDFAGETDADRIVAWRDRLEREGKLSRTGSIRDLVLGSRESLPGTAETR